MIIDGIKESAKLRDQIKKEITNLKVQTNKSPKLSVILIGDFAPSLIYVRNKEKISKEVESAKKTFQKYRWPTIDVSRKSVEETAASVIKIYEISKKNA